MCTLSPFLSLSLPISISPQTHDKRTHDTTNPPPFRRAPPAETARTASSPPAPASRHPASLPLSPSLSRSLLSTRAPTPTTAPPGPRAAWAQQRLQPSPSCSGQPPPRRRTPELEIPARAPPAPLRLAAGEPRARRHFPRRPKTRAPTLACPTAAHRTPFAAARPPTSASRAPPSPLPRPTQPPPPPLVPPTGQPEPEHHRPASPRDRRRPAPQSRLHLTADPQLPQPSRLLVPRTPPPEHPPPSPARTQPTTLLSPPSPCHEPRGQPSSLPRAPSSPSARAAPNSSSAVHRAPTSSVELETRCPWSTPTLGQPRCSRRCPSSRSPAVRPRVILVAARCRTTAGFDRRQDPLAL